MKNKMIKFWNRAIMAFDRFLAKGINAEAVNHPSHYNIPGRKECIEEMIDKFGVEAVRTWCLLSAYKYNYRHELKGGKKDLAKANWCMNKFAVLGGDAVE